MDFGRGLQVGVIRSLEKQGLAFKFNFTISWLIMIPLCYVLPFPADLGIFGVYIAFLIGQTLLQISLQVIISRVDWEALVKKSKDRIDKIKNQLGEKIAAEMKKKALKIKNHDDEENEIK